MTEPHPRPEYPHSSVFGSNLNIQLEQILQASEHNQTTNMNSPVLQQHYQPHAMNPVPSHQQDKYNRRMEMY